MARAPWTLDETKRQLKSGYEDDERLAIGQLATKGSISCGIFIELSFARRLIKETSRCLVRSRFCQVTLARIFCATRFKYFEGGQKIPVQCCVTPGCTDADSFPHLLRCTGLKIPKDCGEGQLCGFLSLLAQSATVMNPGRPQPTRVVQEGEVELHIPPSPDRSEGEISLDLWQTYLIPDLH